MFTTTAVCTLLLASGFNTPASADKYRLLQTVPSQSDGSWDYVTIDEAARRVYVAHESRVDVFDADRGERVGEIADTKGVHGVAVASNLGRGFTSNGQSNSVTVFDLKTLKPITTVSTGKNPDAIHYDQATRRVFAFNGGSASVTVIDATNAQVVGTIELGGRPEFAASDGAGHVFVNLEDKDEVVKLDARELKVLDRWSVTPAKTPVSMAIDVERRRLFVGCRSKSLVVMNLDTGKVIASLPIGARVDATAYDPGTQNVFNSCGDGTLSVMHQDSPDRYSTVETLTTRPGSKTMGLDLKTHHLFVPAAEFLPATGSARPKVSPGTFVLLIYGPGK